MFAVHTQAAAQVGGRWRIAFDCLLKSIKAAIAVQGELHGLSYLLPPYIKLPIMPFALGNVMGAVTGGEEYMRSMQPNLDNHL